MKKLLVSFVLLAILLAGVGCGSAQESAMSPSKDNMTTPTAVSPERGEEYGSIPPPMAPGISTAPSAAPSPAPVIITPQAPTEPGAGIADDWSLSIDRMIVRTGNISLVVADVLSTINQITDFANNYDGYVVSSSSWREGERLVGYISVRVPAERFGEAMSVFRGMAVEVNSENTSSRDVTEEYVDLSAKLSNLEATEEQLLAIMKKAEEVEDILNVQRELTNVRSEIEQIKGRMQYLEQTSNTSLIEVRLEQSELDVSLTANKRGVKEGEEIWFEGDIGGGFSPYSYDWDFGDGNTSTAEYPIHSYDAVGKYTVTLTVTDDRGSTAEETREDYITVLPGWEAGSISGAAWNGLVVFGQVLADIFIWIGIFSPVWIVIGLIIYFCRRWRKKRRARRAKGAE